MSKQLVVFSNGDPWDASTWANVPYMFLHAFRRQFPDIPIVTFNMNSVDDHGPLWLIHGGWNVLITPLLGKLATFNRTKFRHHVLNKKMLEFEKGLQGGAPFLALTSAIWPPNFRVIKLAYCVTGPSNMRSPSTNTGTPRLLKNN